MESLSEVNMQTLSGILTEEIVVDFMKKTTIPETPNKTVEQIVRFIAQPENVNRMITMSEVGKPALSGIVKELEEKFAYSDFPLHFDGPSKNAPNRRCIGWIIKYVMGRYGYTTISEPEYDESGNLRDSEKRAIARIISGCSKYFSYSAIYTFTGKKDYMHLNIEAAI